ncbi:hypothetical protein Q7284_10300 [Glaesserella parasuis]|nr:hypothetical protein [Glaesserella parasuis]
MVSRLSELSRSYRHVCDLLFPTIRSTHWQTCQQWVSCTSMVLLPIYRHGSFSHKTKRSISQRGF